MSIFDAICESPQNDVLAARQAAQAYRLFADVINRKTNADYDIEDANQGEMLGFDCRPMGFDRFGLPPMAALFGLRKPNTLGLSASTMLFGEPKIKDHDGAFVLCCLRDLTLDGVKASVNSVDFMKLFQHEFIHALDFRRVSRFSKPKSANTADREQDDGESTPTSPSAYLNDPLEYNARYHDLVYRFTSVVHEMQANPAYAADLLDLYAISGNFWQDLASAAKQDQHTAYFMKWINSDRRRAMLKRLYKLYHLMMQQANASKVKTAG